MVRTIVLLAPPGTSIVRPLGAGAVFDVALVRIAATGGDAVAKRPCAALGARAEGGEAVAREADALEALAPAGLAPALLARGRDAAGPWLVESAAPGASLRALGETHAMRAPASIWEAAAEAASAALARLHALGDARGPLAFCHGDLSPDNVFFDPPERATFVDFAAAAWRDAPAAVFPAARGTAPYAAPEVLRGDRPPGRPDDTWALAATLAWLAAGPITAASGGPAALVGAAERGLALDRLEARGDLPAGAVAAVRRALAVDPARRLRDAGELGRAIGLACYAAPP